MRERALLLGTLLVSAALVAGCIQADPGALDGATLPGQGTFPLGLPYDIKDKWSHPLVNGTLGILPVEVLEIPSLADGTTLRVGIYRPAVPDGEKVPVLIDAGPYYGQGEGVVESPTDDRLANFLIQNYVPHGYAVVLAAIRGTGDSGGCIELFSENEQMDMKTIVDYFGEQEWSNGAVAMIGKSYDGSTPMMAAKLGSPYLKTIVPIAGVTNMGGMMFRNGSSEFRGPLMHSYVYWPFGFQAEGRSTEHKVANVCPEAAKGAALGPATYATGDITLGGLDDYWTVRNFEPGLLGYNGSIFVVHGLQDWNVDPHMVTDWYNEFQGEKKLLFGQWGHHYPDRPEEHKSSTRADFAETLLRWFDKYLKGKSDVDTGPAVEIEDASGVWRVEPENAYPPLDANWTVLQLTGDRTLSEAAGSPGAILLASPMGAAGAQPVRPATGGYHTVTFETEPLANDTRLSGVPKLHLTVTPLSAGGRLLAKLYDVDDKGETTQIGRAWMDLRYASGGYAPKPVVPGQHMMALMEFYPLDAPVKAGHTLRLVVSQEEPAPATEPIPHPLSTAVEIIVGEEGVSTLQLPVIVRDPQAFDLGWKPLVVTEAETSGGA